MSYKKNIWKNRDIITESKMNNIENGIKDLDDKINLVTIPTKISELTNDSNYVTTTEMTEAINNAQLGGEVDLSGYVTKETGNANQITFADGQTFQAKLDNGTLKGEKGDKGDKGDKGNTGATGLQGPQGAAGENAENPNFTFAINMIASDQTAYVTTTGTYPNLTITFNIPQSTSSGGNGGSGGSSNSYDPITNTITLNTIETSYNESNEGLTISSGNASVTTEEELIIVN